MNNTINKPITMLAEDFTNELVALINRSHLPFFIMESLMKDCINEVNAASKKQLEIDKQNYNEAMLKLQKEKQQQEEVYE